MPDNITSQYGSLFEGAIDHLKTELASIRTGRANPALVENLQVEAYGSRMTLVGLASISAPDARTVQIEPWDKSVVKAIEKAIQEADLGFTPTVAGTVIRINIPAMTEEGRLKMKRLLNEKLEQARIGVRQAREEVRSEIKAAEEAGGMSEDEKYVQLEELDKLAARFNDMIKEIGEEKEREIMTV